MALRAIMVLICTSLCGAAAAESPSIHCMFVEPRILELADTRQLTFRADGQVTHAAISPDGKRVAFLALLPPDRAGLCLVRSSGGPITTVLSAKIELETEPDQPEPSQAEEVRWIVLDDIGVVWSPDSSRFAVAALGMSPSGEAGQFCVLVLAANGACEMAIPFPSDRTLTSDAVFSPDSRRIAARAQRDIAVFDTSYRACLFVRPQGASCVRIAGWAAGGSALRLVTLATEQTLDGEIENVKQLREVPLDAGQERIIDEHYSEQNISPDGKYRTVEDDRPGVIVESTSAGTQVAVSTDPAAAFVGWTPRGMLVYSRSETIFDDPKQRQRDLRTLWLADVAGNKLDHMCIALDAGSDDPTWSSDGLKMAYTCNDRLYVAELVWREPDVWEKYAVGLPLTQEEEKAVMVANARDIAVALFKYLADREDGVYPYANTLGADLGPYMRRPEAFLRPNTEQMIFNFFLSGVSQSDIKEPIDTIMGELDAGYDWKVLIYADGYIKVVPKE